MFRLRLSTAVTSCVVILLYSSALTQNSLTSPFDKISYPSKVAPLRVQNDIVAVQVRTQNDTLGNGEINYTGLFNIGTADSLALLFLFPRVPYSSHVNVRVDGVTYSNDPVRTGAALLTLQSAPAIVDSSIECVYRAGLIEVTQRLTPKKFSRTTGAILIEYRLVNRDPFNAHQVGVLLELDTYINGNDDASVLTSFGYSRIEQEFNAPAMPDFFQAFEGSLVAPGLVAEGTLVGLEAVRPDRMVIGNWMNLRSVQWNYAVPNNQPYDDSAVLLRWNEKTLTPGEVRTVATYYGKGDVTTQAGPLTLHVTAPRNLQASNGQLTPNPFDVNLLVYNDSSITANAVQATLRLPQGLAFVSGEFATKLLAPSNLNAGLSGTVSWKVLAQCPMTDVDLNMIVEVLATPGFSNSVSRQILLPSCSVTLPNFLLAAQPDTATMIAGETRSFQINSMALNGFNQPVQLSYFPRTPGFVGTFSPASVPPNGAAQFDLQTNRNLVAGEYRFIISATGGGLTRSDSLRVRVNAAAPLDTIGPRFANPNPANGATSIPLNTKISVEVFDPAPGSGIDQNGIRMFVNGALVARTITSKGAGYVITHTPATPLRLNEVVNVKVIANDLAQPTNRDSILFAFTTLRDEAQPYLAGHNPAAGATNVSLNTSVSVNVLDDLSGVDSTSLVFAVDGAIIRAPNVEKVSKGYRLRYQPLKPFGDNKIITVILSARDLAVPANSFSGVRYSFTTVRDSLAPEVLELSPQRNAANVSPDFTITARLRDDLTGVDSAAVRMFINGNAVVPALQRSGKDFLLAAKPLANAQLNDTIYVKLLFADLASRRNRDSLEYSFTTIQDKLAPLVLDLQPSPNAVNVTRDVEIRARLRDNLAGVDSVATRLWINGQIAAPILLRENKDFVLSFKPLTPFAFNEIVNVRLAVADLAQPTNADTVSYTFAIVEDRRAPFVTAHSPSRFASNVPPKMAITFEIRDDAAGVDSASIKLRVNGQEAARVLNGTPALYRVSFTPDFEALLRAGDTVFVEIEAADLVRPANVMPRESYFYTLSRDRAAPFTAGHNPQRNSRNVPLQTDIVLEIFDVNPGVDTSSIRMQVNGSIVARQLQSLANGFRVRHSPALRFRDNQTVAVRVEAQDLATPVNVMPPEDYIFTTVRDSLPPVARDFSPRPFEGNISPQTEISFTLEDDLTGVDSSAFVLQINGGEVRSLIRRTVRGFSIHYNLAQQTLSRDTVRVNASFRDLASQPNEGGRAYYFVTRQDRTPPYLAGQNPAPEARNVAEDATITATVVDDHSGVDPQSVVMEVNGAIARADVSTRGRAVTLSFKPPQSFVYNTRVAVSIRAQDLANPPNQMSAQIYSFTVVADTTPPFVTDFTPPNNAREVPTNTTISFKIRDAQAGVDSTALRLFVNGERKPVTFIGTAREYTVTHTPSTDFPVGQSIEVVIQARDLAMPPNVMPPRTFRFTTAEPLPDLIASDLRAVGEFQLGRETKLKGLIQREGPVRENFRVTFLANGRTLKDTTIAANTLGTRLELEASARLETGGAHLLEMNVDADDKIQESNEANNRAQLPVQIAEVQTTKLTVRPNPFTPNGDGFNDEVEFNFSGLTLERPTLHIFDVNGVPIYLTNHSSGKRFTWNGRDDSGNAVQPGVYFYTLRERGNNVRSGYVVVAR